MCAPRSHPVIKAMDLSNHGLHGLDLDSVRVVLFLLPCSMYCTLLGAWHMTCTMACAMTYAVGTSTCRNWYHHHLTSSSCRHHINPLRCRSQCCQDQILCPSNLSTWMKGGKHITNRSLHTFTHSYFEQGKP